MTSAMDDAAATFEAPAARWGVAVADRPDRAPIVHVVDDDERGLQALVRLLQTRGFDARGYRSGAAFLAARSGEGPACLVLDVGLPGLGGEELQATLTRAGDAMPVVFLTGRGDIAMSVRAMKAGAVDFLTKPVRSEALLAAIDAAIGRARANGARDAQLRERGESYATLTPREREVMALVAQGRPNRVIAARLGVTVRTVKAHRAQVMHKMRVDSLADLVLAAARLGLTRGD
jgi:FixJ family two-component response regulator